MPTYTRSLLKARVNAGIKGKIGVLVDANQTLNDAAREVFSEIDLRSSRRKTPLSPPLFTNIFEYACPSDLKGYKLINIAPQTDAKTVEYVLVPSEEFTRRQEYHKVAIADADFGRKLLVNALVNDLGVTISSMDSLTASGGTWVLFGDGENVTADDDNYVRGTGSINWDISAAAGTTAGIQNSGLNTFDITPYTGGNGAAFVWVYISSTTDLTNFILRLGNDATAYYSYTATTQADGTAFAAGWNLLRFTLTIPAISIGSVTATACDYAALYMTKATTKVSETDYRFDHLILKKGEIHNVSYYSKYPWQSSAGAYKANSTVDSDLLNVDDDEYNLIVAKGIELAGDEADEENASAKAAKRYMTLKKEYEKNNPSEAKLMTSTYADFIKM